MIELVQALQKLRKFTLNLQPPTLAERESIVGQLLALIMAIKPEELQKLATEGGLGIESTRRWEIEGAIDLGLKLPKLSSEETYPVGVVVLLSPQIFPLRTTLERWMPSFLAGNATLIKMSSKTLFAAELLKRWFEQAGVPADSFHIVTNSREDLGDFLTSHPAIRAFSFAGSYAVGEQIAAKGLWGRRPQFWMGGFTTNLILDSAGLASAARDLEVQLKEQLWKTPMYPQRWIVLDPIEDEAAATLDKIFAGRDLIEDQKQLLKTAEDEEGKIRSNWIHHLPLCSTLHQTELRVPTLSLNSVRYPFDMQKWVHHANTAYAIQVWGEAEKAKKLIPKLEAGRITLNASLNHKDSIFFGAKQSIFGINDLNPGGLFFSEHRSVKDL